MNSNGKSVNNGNGATGGNSQDMRAGSPVPQHLASPAVIDAKAVTMTFWDLL
jgi:hypothetical protein